jgi:ABC-2 type transport system ATP-binding protein
MSLAIELQQVSKKFNDFLAVDNINLQVQQGDIYGFLGPNGSGKSTTLRMIMSLIKPTNGTINVMGFDIKTHRGESMKHVGCIIEKPDFYTYLSAHENMQLHARACGIVYSKSEYDKLYEAVGLLGREKDKVKAYSHGMKQRLGLAQCLLHNPSLIILDEPNTGLDPKGIIDLRNILLALNKNEGKTILFSSHILSEVQEICTSLIVINKGKTEVQGTVHDLLLHADLLLNVEVNDVEKMKQFLSTTAWQQKLVSQHQHTFIFKVKKDEIHELNKQLLQYNIEVLRLDYKKELEDYFLKITEAHT